MPSHLVAASQRGVGGCGYGSCVAWSWRCESGSNENLIGMGGESFPTQADAETWIGETWRELVDKGVDHVMLLEGDRVVYGPMSLQT